MINLEKNGVRSLRKVLPLALAAWIIGTMPGAQAELMDGPAVLTVSVEGATSSTVTLKLEDGRTTKKIPRKFFGPKTDFYPGRIVNLKLTDEIRAAIFPDVQPKDLTEAELVKLIESFQKSVGPKIAGQAKKHSFFNVPILELLPIASSYAEAAKLCAPLNNLGYAFSGLDKDGRCTYDEPGVGYECKNSAQIAAIKESNKAISGVDASTVKFSTCNPLVYGKGRDGKGICRSDAELYKDTCTTQFQADCAKDLRADGTKGCILRTVLPAAKANPSGLVALANALANACDSNSETAKAVDHSLCGAGKTERYSVTTTSETLAKIVHDNERSPNRCRIIADDEMNVDFTDANKEQSKAVFTTITGPACNGATLCVRQVKCETPNPGVGELRFVRCRADQCGSASACLSDKEATGSGKRVGETAPVKKVPATAPAQ